MLNSFASLKQALVQRYELKRTIGQGGMATVYLARDRKHDRDVAVKVLRPELAATLGADRFLLEIEIAAKLTHPHIVPLFDSGEADGFLYYVQPFIEGKSLGDHLSGSSQLEIADVVAILIDVADALGKAHSLGVVHRDIKPDNIMLSDSHALVTDFGVAKAVTEAKGHNLTTAGTALGTPVYMAPEQAAADPKTDHRADIYALGAVGYEMLAGTPPFTGSNLQQIIAAHVKDEPVPVETRRPDAPPTLAAAIMRCLNKDPNSRWQSADELLGALGAHRRTPTPGSGQLPARVGRNNLMVAAAAVVVVFVVLVVINIIGRDTTSDTLNPDVIAVTPFDVLDTESGMWREGFAELLSHNLDGAGRLRTISPTVGFAKWEGRADPAAATEFARGLGAGLTLFGRIVGEGPDSVRVLATLMDVSGGNIIRDVEVRGAERNMVSLADSVSASILTDLSRLRSLGAARLNSLGSGSPTAIREFLLGESHYRSFRMDSAQLHYDRALAADSAFALAWARLGMIAAWEANNTPLATTYRLKAGTLNSQLSTRESLLVVADSLAAALSEDWLPEPQSAQRMRRYFNTLRQANEWYPDDAQILYRVGEAQMHRGWAERVTETATLNTFDQAARLDSAFALVYPHLTNLRYSFRDLEAGNAAIRAYLELGPSGPTAVGALTTLELVTQLAAGDSSFLDTASAFQLLGPTAMLARSGDSLQAGVQAARRLAELDPSNRSLASYSLAFRGHLVEARSTVGEPQRGNDWLMLAEMDYLENRAEPLGGVRGAPTLEGVHPMLALVVWAEQGDTIPIKQFIDNEGVPPDSRRRSAPAYHRYWTERALAFLDLARGDSTTALQKFDDLSDYNCAIGCSFQEIVHARLLSWAGRANEAAQLLEPFPGLLFSEPLPSEMLWVLQRARAREQSGDNRGARVDFARVVDVWRFGDETVQSAVSEARAALQRLVSEPEN